MVRFNNKFVTMKRHIEGAPEEEDFEIRSEEMKAGLGETVVKVLYISMDPYQLNRMKRHSSTHRAVDASSGLSPAQMINAHAVGRIVESGNADLKEGDLVRGPFCWGEYCIVKPGDTISKLDPLGFPPFYHLGVLGIHLDLH